MSLSVHRFPLLRVLGCLVLLSSLARADSEWMRLEARRLELAAEVKVLTMRVDEAEQQTEAVEQVRAELAEQRARQRERQAEQEMLSGRIAGLRGAMEEHRGQARSERRKATQGLRLDVLTSAAGREYRNVEIRRVSPAGLEFRHDQGLARLTADQLTRAQRVEYGLDLEQAEEHLAAESQRVAAFHRWMDAREEELSGPEEEEAVRRVASNTTLPRDRSTRARPAGTHPLREPARRLGSGSVWRGSRTRTYYYYHPSVFRSRSAGSSYSTIVPTRRTVVPRRVVPRTTPPACPPN